VSETGLRDGSRPYERRRIWAVAVVAGFATCLYLLTLADTHTFDAVTYAALAQNPALPQSLMLFLHPHHLAYHILSYIVYRLWLLLGWQGGSLFPLQVLSALLAGLGLVLFARLLSQWVRTSVVFDLPRLLAFQHQRRSIYSVICDAGLGCPCVARAAAEGQSASSTYGRHRVRIGRFGPRD